MLISNTTIVFLKILFLKYPNKEMLVKNLCFWHFCFFPKYCNLTNLRIQISGMTIVFNILAHKCVNKTFLVPVLEIFLFLINFAVWQISNCWFQIWQWLLKILPQKHPNKASLVTNLDNFFFSEFSIELNLRVLISNIGIAF